MSYVVAVGVLLVLTVAAVCLIGWFPRTALRAVVNPNANVQPDPPPDMPNAKRWYVESNTRFGGRPYSCSFVEFDERGDYLDFHQHQHAYQKIRQLTKAAEPLVLVIFVHGWRNHSQSGNVTSFNYFLSQLASAPTLAEQKSRVHGVYLSWRGAMFGHTLNARDAHYQITTQHFGQDPIVDLRYAACWKALAFVVETFFYWNRKSVPEHKSSGTALSRTVFTCACTAKREYHAGSAKPNNSQVFLIGHSLGALMVERTVQNAAIGALTDSWPWNPQKLPPTPNPLPFDTVLCVNSAAPSIYAKQFQGYLAAHRDAMRRQKVDGAGAPIFISVTSEADQATGTMHRLGNWYTPFVPTLRRNYRADDYALDVALGTVTPKIPQWYYYTHTPGHNPLLVNRFIEPAPRDISATRESHGTEEGNLFHSNLRAPARTAGASFVFFTTARKQGHVNEWSVNMPPTTTHNKKWSQYEGQRPIAWRKNERDNAYWIVRCPRDIIADHNDIWSQQAMEMYAALYGIADQLMRQPPAVP
jgi:hypothetical protein